MNPLRKNLFVRADRVMKLRQLLERLSSVTGLTCEEKDPEEFLNSLLTQIMRAEPFLKVILVSLQLIPLPYASLYSIKIFSFPNFNFCSPFYLFSFDSPAEFRSRCILLPTICGER